MNTLLPSSSSSPSPAPARALVLGGGGSAGNAWLIGVVAGLSAAGIDVTDADLLIGTSAGATAAAQLAAGTPSELFDAILTAVLPQRPVPAAGGSRAAGAAVVDQLERTGRIISESTDAADMRRRMGAWSIGQAAASDPSRPAQWRATVAARLDGTQWPSRRLLITAVDAETGDGVAFDRESGVDLVDAIAASTSSGPAYPIGGRPFIDGGYRRNENADLAAGYQRVLVLSPFGGRTRHPLEWGMQLAAQLDELRHGGSRVETIFPDAAALAVFGDDMMNLAARAPAARAGLEQGRALAQPLAEFWN